MLQASAVSSDLYGYSPGSRLFGDRLLKSLEYLGFKSRSHNAAAACDSISRIVSEQQKYALFRDMFPEAWIESRASLYRAGHYKKYSERTNQLFELINEKCFPFLGLWHDDPDAEFERFSIPPLNFDLCCEEFYYEDMRTSYVAGLLFYFRESEIWDFFSDKYGLSASDFPDLRSEPHPNVWKEKQAVETKAYSDLLKLVDHATGNPWLDGTHCQYADWYEWSRENIESLTESYRQADRAFQNLQELDGKIESDPRKILLELITFWNLGKLP